MNAFGKFVVGDIYQLRYGWCYRDFEDFNIIGYAKAGDLIIIIGFIHVENVLYVRCLGHSGYALVTIQALY